MRALKGIHNAITIKIKKSHNTLHLSNDKYNYYYSNKYNSIIYFSLLLFGEKKINQVTLKQKKREIYKSNSNISLYISFSKSKKLKGGWVEVRDRGFEVEKAN
jgi:hypothetical protein